MGCGFDTSLVWSSTETSPEVCETDPSQQATSYASCGNFVSAMEQLYASRPDAFAADANPLRIIAGGQARSNFENVQFPTRFNWIIDQISGIASINDASPYLYDFDESLSTSETDLFCGAELGPPTVLAQACDASMDFLLGSSVSIGMLTSTANKAVNGEFLGFDSLLEIVCSHRFISKSQSRIPRIFVSRFSSTSSSRNSDRVKSNFELCFGCVRIRCNSFCVHGHRGHE